MPQTLEPLLRGHKFFAGLDPDHLAVITGCASNVVFPAGAFLFREGTPADSPETSCTLKQKHVGQTIVQFPQVRHRAATSSQRACS